MAILDEGKIWTLTRDIVAVPRTAGTKIAASQLQFMIYAMSIKLAKNARDVAVIDPTSQGLVDVKTPQTTVTAIKDDDDFESLVKPAAFSERSLPQPKSSKDWVNCNGSQTCTPTDHRYPRNLDELIQAVSYARDNELKVRCAGAGHSFSDVCLTGGMLLDFSPKTRSTSEMSRELPIDSATLKNPSQAKNLFSVESGIKIRDLNAKLSNLDESGKPKKALATLGAYDGQTLAGAISTGTHGSMIQQGPIASLVRSLVLVSETGKVYQIEPSNGITDPSKFKPGDHNIELKQDDDWFQSTVIAMGCMGIIYSYTLEVVDAFLLEENRSVTTWESVKTRISAGLQNDYYEIDINPYLTDVEGKDQNVAVEIIRTIRDPAKYNKSGSRGIVNWLSGILQIDFVEESLVAFLNLLPWMSPSTISRALNTLKDRSYVDESCIVLDLETVAGVEAYALELSFDATKTEDIPIVVEKIVSTFQSAAKQDKGYLAGPIALRFVKAAEAYAAPQQGRFTMMVEMDMLQGIEKGQDLLKYIKSTLAADPSLPGMRVHWGLDLDTVSKEEVTAKYPQWSKWLSVYHQLNTTGMWNNKFTDRVEISKPVPK